jgi:GT2 family glycosyltransferase
MTKSKVSVIILNYNGALDTIDCLISLSKCTYPNFNIIVVDNLSSDDSMFILKEYIFENYENHIDSTKLAKVKTSCTKKTEITLIQSGINGGYGFGNNIGIKCALADSADYVLILNNDTIVEPDFLGPLLTSAEEDPTVGIVSSKILYNHDRTKIWFNGGRYSPLSAKIEHINFNETDYGQSANQDINFISGCLWLIPARIFEKVGLINDSYFMYMEDLEFCQRVIANGFKLRVNSNSIIYHKVGVSSGGQFSKFSVSYRVQNYFIFCFENFNSKLLCYFSSSLFSLRQIVRLIKSKNIKLIPTVFSSLQEGYRKIKYSPNKMGRK